MKFRYLSPILASASMLLTACGGSDDASSVPEAASPSNASGTAGYRGTYNSELTISGGFNGISAGTTNFSGEMVAIADFDNDKIKVAAGGTNQSNTAFQGFEATDVDLVNNNFNTGNAQYVVQGPNGTGLNSNGGNVNGSLSGDNINGTFQASNGIQNMTINGEFSGAVDQQITDSVYESEVNGFRP